MANVYFRANPPRGGHRHRPARHEIASMLLPSLCAWLVLLASPSDSRDEPRQTPPPTRNRLAGQTSLYVLQHAGNPVDWYPWGPEAFERARKENRPIFLSVGYSTCYWCHVMERESFQNDEIASYLNQHFVCIKVDREERPDIDQVYMNALQVFAGRGGWPMTLFLTPDGRPFFAATYLPAEPRDGLPSFLQIARAVDRAWTEKPEEIQQDADRLSSAVRRVSEGKLLLARAPLSQALVEKGLAELAESFDPVHGGFGFDPLSPRRPKFPEPINLLFLLDQHRKGREVPEALGSPLAMVEKTLDHLMRGGIRDQLGGGYHRYSTDRSWSIPHFEKMLYDNALLARVFLTTHEITGDPRWRAEAESILNFVSRDLTSPDGPFYSAIDAEVDALEGASYLWTRDEVLKILGNRPDVDLFLASYGLDQQPNFEGDRFVLLLPRPLDEIARRRGLSPQDIEQRLTPLRAMLLEARQRRPQPVRDEKILTSWNGLMLGAYAEAFRVLGDLRYRQAAERSARFLLESLRNPDGSLMRSFSAGKAGGPAFLDDYAYLGEGLLLLHQATGEASWREQAKRIAQRLLDDFADPQGGFFFTADDHETLIARVKDSFDGALPNPNAVATRLLLALAYPLPPSHPPKPNASRDHVQKTLESLSGMMAEKPSAMPSFLLALAEFLSTTATDPKSSGFLADTPPPDAMTSASRIQVSARLDSPGDVAPGQTVRARLEIQIADGWHLNANPAGGPTLVPTLVETPPDSPMKLVDPRYPAGKPLRLGDLGDEIPVYSGKITIQFSLQIPDSTPPGERDLPLRVRFQACDDRSCLAPSTVSAPIRLRVARP